jgi:hypothetical protein
VRESIFASSNARSTGAANLNCESAAFKLFEIVFLRCANAARTSAKKVCSLLTLTGGCLRAISLITDDWTFGAGLKAVGGTSISFMTSQ